MPIGLWRPSGLGIHTRFEGFARNLPLCTRSWRSVMRTLQPFTVLLPCHVVHPGCRVAFERVVSIPKHFYRDMVYEIGETKVPIPCRCFTYPVKSVQCLPLSLRTGRRRLSRISPWSSAFPPEPPPQRGEHAVLFGSFSGTTPMSDCSATCMQGLRPQAFPSRSAYGFPQRMLLSSPGSRA